MLSDTLNTNEVKNAAGTEVEFERVLTEGRTTEFQVKPEVPSQKHRIKVSHQETGAGLKLRRRSVLRFDKTVISGVDSVTPVTVSAYAVLDAPVGAMTANTESTNVLAELMSLLATTGAGTTVLFDCSGNGAAALVGGTL